MTRSAHSSSAGAPSQRRLTWLVCVGLAAAVGWLYAPVTGFGFVNFDDPGYVVKNPIVNQGFTLDGIVRAFTEARMANWHPLTWLSHMADVELFGLDPGGHHLTSLVLHALNAMLLFLVLRAMTGSLGTAALVAAFFAVHPLRVESVAWVSERKDLLAASLGLATLAAWTAYVRAPSARRYALAALCLALGLMAKPMLVSLPCVLLLLDVWPYGRWSPDDPSNAPGRGRLIVEKLPLLGLAAASMAVTYVVQQRAAAVSPLEAVPLASRLAGVPLAYAGYLGKLVWPVDLAFFYPLRLPAGASPDAALWLRSAAALALLLGITLVAVALRRRLPALLVGWLWFAGMLVPVAGVVQVGAQAMADRYTYLPLIGVTLAVVHAGGALARRGRVSRVTLLALAAVLLVACAIVTRSQVRTWRSSYRLYTHAVQVTEGNALAHHGLGLVLVKRGDLDGAREQFERTLAIEPRFHRAWTALAEMQLQASALPAAAEHFERALAIEPLAFEALYGLATVHIRSDAWDAAAEQLQRALAVRPRSAQAHNALGLVRLRQGRLDDAAPRFREALRLDPDLREAQENLAQLRALRRG